MFVELQPLLKACSTLKLSIKMKGDQMVVFVMPEGETKETALRQPLVMTASAEELDAGFAEHLAAYSGAHASLAEQVAATTAILGEAQKAQVTKATKALAGKGARASAPGKSSAGSGDVDGDDDGESSSDEPEGSNDEVAGGAPAPSAAPAENGTDLSTLF
ncbi:PRTRC system protein E [Paraburkholderia sp. Tr-20389]|uniref:PRTRC system protein E n=1 Tax=Paraburkholderia sp. Tr-20389 TaxID=2703903 RepID=UPI00197F2736|nr:PRTRC system protein E [Paraburkholderia sp. Tr-20389]MBN3754274.1 PRTRC system protein E [Paraburkholderia sp. Tr-20389]